MRRRESRREARSAQGLGVESLRMGAKCFEAVARSFAAGNKAFQACTKRFVPGSLLVGRLADRHEIEPTDKHTTVPQRKGQAMPPGLVSSVSSVAYVASLAFAATLLITPACVFSQDVSSSSILPTVSIFSGNTVVTPVSSASRENLPETESRASEFGASEFRASKSRASESGAKEFRALWVLRNTLVSEREIDRMLRQAKKSGFNVLFVQVRGRGDAFYNSSVELRAELLPHTQFDPLSYLVAEAHRNGLEVHPWLNVFLVWSAAWKPTDTRHAVLLHPDWVAVRSDGRALSELSREEIEAMGIEGVFLAPANPGVREHIRSVIRELVQNYDIDGVHLDYVRYPDMNVGYDQGTRTEFMRRYGVDPRQMADDREALLDLYGDKGLQDLRVLWDRWRVSNLEDLIDSIRCDLKELNPGVRLSAAVVADQRSARDKHGQDWPSWLERGILDFAVPMCYSASTRFVQNQIRSIQDLVGTRKFYPGIAMYNQSPGRVVEKVRVLRRLGITGFSMFCYDPERPRSAVLGELSRSVFAFPARPW